MITLSPTEKAWLAGFIDGEGYVGITFTPRYHPYLIVTNKNRDSISFVQRLVPEGKVYESSPLSPIFQFKLTRREALYNLKNL